MLEKLIHIFPPTPEQKKRKNIATATAYSRTVNQLLRSDKFDEQIQKTLVEKITLKWLTRHARCIFPTIDEFEVSLGLVVNHPDHDQCDKHQCFTLRQLEAWIDNQTHNLT